MFSLEITLNEPSPNEYFSKKSTCLNLSRLPWGIFHIFQPTFIRFSSFPRTLHCKNCLIKQGKYGKNEEKKKLLHVWSCYTAKISNLIKQIYMEKYFIHSPWKTWKYFSTPTCSILAFYENEWVEGARGSENLK